MDDDALIRLWMVARGYVSACLRHETLLTPDDVHDLATDVLLATVTRLPHVQHPERYIRAATRHRVMRVLRHRRSRIVDRQKADTDAAARDVPTDDGWGDRDRDALDRAQAALRRADAVTRHVVMARLEEPPTPYRDLEADTGLRASALRMRVARFLRDVRQADESRMGGCRT